jgi:hypothetical protein
LVRRQKCAVLYTEMVQWEELWLWHGTFLEDCVGNAEVLCQEHQRCTGDQGRKVVSYFTSRR